MSSVCFRKFTCICWILMLYFGTLDVNIQQMDISKVSIRLRINIAHGPLTVGERPITTLEKEDDYHKYIVFNADNHFL